MRIQYKLILLILLLFLGSATVGCLLQYRIYSVTALESAINKADNVAITIANFVAYDEKYLTKENKAKILETTNIDALSVIFKDEIDDLEEFVSSQNDKINILRFRTFNGRTVVVELLATPTEYIEIRDSFWGFIFRWISVGLFLAIFVIFYIIRFVNSKIADIHSLITLNTYEPKESNLKIREFEDLRDISILLSKLSSHRLLIESKKMLKINSKSSFAELIVNQFYIPEDFKFGDFKLSVQTAESNPEGSFYAKISQNEFFFAKLKCDKSSIDILSDSIIARDLFINLISTKSLEETLKEVSNIYDIDKFTLISFVDDIVKTNVYKDSIWFTESFKSPKTLLFTTAQMGESVRFYSNLEVKKDKLLIISKLLPDSRGGIFILIERI